MTARKYVDTSSASLHPGYMMQLSQREQQANGSEIRSAQRDCLQSRASNQDSVILCPAEPTHAYAGFSRGTGREASG